MKTKLLSVLSIASFLLSLHGLLAADDRGTSSKPQVIILKLDDVKQVKNAPVHRSWQRVLDYIEKNGLKASFGIICSSLETDNAAYFDWIKTVAKRGNIEFWLHGYRDRATADKTGEFEQGTFEEQKTVFEKCERLSKEKLGFSLPAFGPHWSGTTDATERALDSVPEIKIWLYGPKTPKFYKKVSLPRVLGLENPTFVPDFAKFKAAYERVGAAEQYLVLQGHPPNWWKEERWNGFIQIVEFLKAKGCVFMTPSEYVESVNAKLHGPAGTVGIAAADAHLVVCSPSNTAVKDAPTAQPASKQNIIVFKEPGRYGGWPANHGLWQWGDELVIGFKAAWYKHAANDHAVDRSKPFENWQARSLNGGKTWRVENSLPFTSDKQKRPAPLNEPLDFSAPDFALMFCFGGLHVGPSWFYVSNDRCKTWRGPFKFEVEGIDKICTRTDLIVLGPRDCLMFGSAAKQNDGKEGRVFCARTTDGGLRWKLVSLIGPEPAEGDFAIMPSTVRLPSGALITTIRKGKGGFNITAWRSDDLGRHWASLGDATPNIGSNPPALAILKEGRLCLTYGYRRKPYGVRARISSDEGRTWGPEIILRDDGLTGDLGYPRSVVRSDGKVLTVYYFNGPRDEDRAIEATLWKP